MNRRDDLLQGFSDYSIPAFFSSLFPDAKVRLHMNTAWAAGNHVRVRSSRWAIPNCHHSTQVFLNNVLPDSKTMDITSFSDGSLYLGGWGAVPQPLPDSADKVKPQQEEIDTMVELFLYQLGSIAVSFAESSPDNADLLKRNIQAIRTTHRNAQLTSFMEDERNADIKVATNDALLYDGAPDDDDRRTKAINDKKTLN
ncbi:hypothetical protein EIK77_000446 [Talaromyces pinophilus]|nr:hypothetical protein EIK77_000446 [Talaromyces pinophilus]PCG88715.1 Hypothetical protein PENO1_108720 [Penicillium occitanis (nom. inval.)]PCG88876.1 hypothetical protein PENOC_109100 [Penicillium occitanis (nom. inval.)]